MPLPDSMATVQIYQPSFTQTSIGSVTEASDSLIQITAGSLVIDYFGQGFVFDDSGIEGGTVTGYDVRDATRGGLQFSVRGLALSAISFFSTAAAGPYSLAQFVFFGADTIIGSSFGDEMHGYGGPDVLNGGAGNDTLHGDYMDTSPDTLVGGVGDDFYYVSGEEYGPADLVLEDAGGGYDGVETHTSYVLPANVEWLRLQNGAFIQRGTGNALPNLIIGNDAANILDGGEGTDTLQGGAGDDSYRVDRTDDLVQDSSGNDTIVASADYQMPLGIENLVMAGQAHHALGNAEANRITGSALNNLILAYDGNDVLDGGVGADTLYGGAGDDTYAIDQAGDVVVELAGEGTDWVVSTLAAVVLQDHVENVTLLSALGAAGTGNGAANLITGGAGPDTLDGGVGADTLRGGLGDDTYFVDHVGDVLSDDLTSGHDTVYASVSYTLPESWVEDLYLTGPAALSATGNLASNRITGNAAANVLSGGIGEDTLDGGGGADTMEGGWGADTFLVDDPGDVAYDAGPEQYYVPDTVLTWAVIEVGAGIEVVRLMGDLALRAATGNGATTVYGNDAPNVLAGRYGSQINGAGGDDTLSGGFGALLAGGTGNDQYYSWTQNGYGAANILELDGEGIDTLHMSSDMWTKYFLRDQVENLVLESGYYAVGNDLSNLIVGNAGSNWLDARAGTDTLVGGDGDDLYVIDGPEDIVLELPGGGRDTLLLLSVFDVDLRGTGIEEVALASGQSDAGARIIGNGDDNRISGTFGADWIDGGGGGDEMRGSKGDDTYVVDNAGDRVIEEYGGGNDTVLSVLSFDGSTRDVENVEKVRLRGDAVEARGNNLDNLLSGNAAGNLLAGLYGDDTLMGEAGDDTLLGGAGNDLLDGDAGYDVVEYDGLLSAYTVSRLGDELRVEGDGSDLLLGIEEIRFADGQLVIDAHPATGSVLVPGEARVGVELQAQAQLQDGDGMGDLSWQWMRDGEPIAGAISSNYVPVPIDVGAQLTARARFTDGDGNQESVWSAPTAAVFGASVAPVLSARPLLLNGPAGPVTWLLDFDRDVVGVTPEDFAVSHGAATSVTGVGQRWLLQVQPQDGYEGELSVQLQPAAVLAAGGATNDAALLGVTIADTRAPQTGASQRSAGLDPSLLLELAFDEAVLAGSVGLVLKRADTGEVLESIDQARVVAGGNRLLIDPSVALAAGQSYLLELPAGAVRDAAGNESAAFAITLSTSLRFEGGAGADRLEGTAGFDLLVGGAGADTLHGLAGDDTLDGGSGADVAVFAGARKAYAIQRLATDSFEVKDSDSGRDGTDQVSGVERLQFLDSWVDLTLQARAAAVPAAQLKTLEELYVGFFNRIPEADGLRFWIGELQKGVSLTSIANQFYQAGVQFGVYSLDFTEEQFIKQVYDYVLGRPQGSPLAPPENDVDYWEAWLGATPQQTHGAMVLQMLSDVHTYFENIIDPNHPGYPFQYVAAHLNNKAAVANYYAVELGLGMYTPAEDIAFGMQLASLITPTDTSAAIALIGISD